MIAIQLIIPTDKPELILKLSNGQWRLLTYQDLISQKLFVAPNDWNAFSYDARSLQFHQGLTLALDWIIQNSKAVNTEELRGRSLLISEKHCSSAAFFAIRLYPFADNFITVAETNDFRSGSGGLSAYNLQNLKEKNDWREICSKAGSFWLTILFDSRKDWSKEELVEQIIKKITAKFNSL